MLTNVNSNKHSSYSSTFPIYLFTQTTEEVPDEEAVEPSASEDKLSEASETPESTPDTDNQDPVDSDEAIVEEEVATEEKEKAEPAPPKMKTVVTDEWVQLNALPPLWMRSVHVLRSTCQFLTHSFRDSKNISDGKTLPLYRFCRADVPQTRGLRAVLHGVLEGLYEAPGLATLLRRF
jgi:hypothetical protein